MPRRQTGRTLSIPPTSLQTAKNACFSAFPTTSGIEAFLRVKNAREPSKIGRSGCIEGASFLHSLTLPYNPPEQLKIPRWQHRTGSSPVTGTIWSNPWIRTIVVRLGVASFLFYVVFMRLFAILLFKFNATPKPKTGEKMNANSKKGRNLNHHCSITFRENPWIYWKTGFQRHRV